MLNYTLDPYQPRYTPEAFHTLREARLRGGRPDPASAVVTPEADCIESDPLLDPLPVEELGPLHDLQVALLGCTAAVYQNLGEVFHTAVGVELAANEGLALPPRPTHAAVVSDVGRRVDQFVRAAVVENAWLILSYGSLGKLVAGSTGGLPVSLKSPDTAPVPEPGRVGEEKLRREFYFGTPSAEMEERYRMQNIGEPLRQYGEYLDGLRPNRDGTTLVRRIPTAIRPRPYPEALEVINRQGQEALRLAGELSSRITDISSTAVRIDLNLSSEGEDRANLIGGLDYAGEAVAILFRQILEAAPNVADFSTVAPIRAMVATNMLRTPSRRRKRRR